MADRTIYVVTADTSYEGFSNVRAFDEKPVAEAFAAKCRAYSETRPHPPSVVEDTPENDALFAKWSAEDDRWQKRHPAGSARCWADMFSVQPLRLARLKAAP